MRCPEQLYGTQPRVEQTAARFSAECLAGRSWPGDAQGRDVETSPGLVMINPAGITAGQAGFHCYLPGTILTEMIIRDDLSPVVEQQCFNGWLDSSWGMVNLLAPINVAWFRQPARFWPFLRRVSLRWSDLTAIGPRYSNGASGQHLGMLASNLTYVLANMGVAAERLREPMTTERLSRFMVEVSDWDGRPVVEQWE